MPPTPARENRMSTLTLHIGSDHFDITGDFDLTTTLMLLRWWMGLPHGGGSSPVSEAKLHELTARLEGATTDLSKAEKDAGT